MTFELKNYFYGRKAFIFYLAFPETWAGESYIEQIYASSAMKTMFIIYFLYIFFPHLVIKMISVVQNSTDTFSFGIRRAAPSATNCLIYPIYAFNYIQTKLGSKSYQCSLYSKTYTSPTTERLGV